MRTCKNHLLFLNQITRPKLRQVIIATIFAISLAACSGSDAPDVSDIEVNLELQRFEQDFFTLDTNDLEGGLAKLQAKYPVFLADFIQKVLGLPPLNSGQPETRTLITKFLSDYRPIKDSTDKVFKNFEEPKEAILQGLKYVKHYFPQYKTPEKLITFIGPLDAYFEGSTAGYGDALTTDALIIGLQLHLGSNFSVYRSEMGQALFPAYISRKFSPEYIPVNAMKNIVDDIYPDNTVGKSLVEKMVDKGKRLYLLDRFMPQTEDTLKIGYTEKQLKGSYDNEGLIWNFILTNSLAYNTDPSIIKGYIGEAPNTAELGEGSPGYIGLFIGRQIVRKYMEKYPATTLPELIKLDPKKLFELSKYRPG
ncbi:gliding motility lipoprotein GldB [Flavitalea antarctica]